MARSRGIENVEKDLTGNLERDLNTLVRVIITDLSTEKHSAVDTGEEVSVDTTYSDIKAPVEFIESTENNGRERIEAKIYISRDLIGDNQPSFEDEVKLTYAGSLRTGQIINIDTKQGGQTYLFTLLVRF